MRAAVCGAGYGKELEERLPDARRDVHDHMPAMQVARVIQSTGVGDHLQVSLERQGVVAHPHRFVCRIEARLQPLILRRDTGRALVRVAAQRLDAPNGEQKAAPNVDKVCAQRDMRRDVATRGNLSRRDKRHCVPETFSPEGVIDRRKTLNERQTDVVGQRQWGCA